MTVITNTSTPPNYFPGMVMSSQGAYLNSASGLTIIVAENTTGVVAQLATNLTSPVFSEFTDVANISLDASGNVTLATGLVPAATRTLNARVVGTFDGATYTIDKTFTIAAVAGVVVEVLPGVDITFEPTLNTPLVAGATVGTITGRVAGDDVALSGADASQFVLNGAKTLLLVGVADITTPGNRSITLTQSKTNAANVPANFAVPVTSASLISAVAADGWQATWASGTPPTFDPDGSPVAQTFSRAGYDTAGATTTYSEDMTMLRRVRQPYPSETLPTADSVALEDYIYSTDSCSGVTNSSAEVSPVPIANWVMRDRQLVGDSVFWEIIAFHRNFRNSSQVACVRVRGNDGTTQTPWQVVSTTAVSTYAEDANPIETYSGTLDISALATGLIWLEAEVFPWIGGPASVLKSENSSVPREFSRRYHLKDTARAASPPLAYVASTGNDATGVWSTTAATALATPFLTVTGALTAMTVGANATVCGSKADGCRIRIVDTVSLGAGATTTRPQNCAAVIVERAPGTARAAAIVTHGASFRGRLGVTGLLGGLTEGAICFYDLTINRTGAFTMFGEAGNQLQLHFHNIDFQNSSTSKVITNSHQYFYGVTLASYFGLGQTAGVQTRLIRGLTVDCAGASGVEGWVIVGSKLTRTIDISYSDTTKPFICYNNKWINPSSTGGVGAWIGTVSGGDIGAIAYVQNLIECYHTTGSTAGFRIANDSPVFGNIVHAVVYANTDTGYGSVSRANYFYDEAPVARFHKLARHTGCIVSQLNTKGDVFELDGTRLGQFAYSHGVGCQGNFTMFRTNSGNFASEMQTYPGPGSIIGTSTTVRNDPLFTNYQASNNSGGALATGGGDYTLTGPSPARGIVTVTGLRFDMAGSARASTNDAAGCYA